MNKKDILQKYPPLMENAYDFIDFLVLMAYFSGKTRK